jgi:hypothetical protein
MTTKQTSEVVMHLFHAMTSIEHARRLLSFHEDELPYEAREADSNLEEARQQAGMALDWLQKTLPEEGDE